MLFAQYKCSKSVVRYHHQSHLHFHLHYSSLPAPRTSSHSALGPKPSCPYSTHSINSSPNPLCSSGPINASGHSRQILCSIFSTSSYHQHLFSAMYFKKGSFRLLHLCTQLIIQTFISYTSVPVFPFFIESEPFKVTSDTVIKPKSLFMTFRIFRFVCPHISFLKYSLVDIHSFSSCGFYNSYVLVIGVSSCHVLFLAFINIPSLTNILTYSLPEPSNPLLCFLNYLHSCETKQL